MRTRRLLFVRPRKKSGLTPVYVALVSLMSLGGLGFAVALWPEEPAPSTTRATEGEAATAGRSIEGGLTLPPENRKPRSRTTWM